MKIGNALYLESPDNNRGLNNLEPSDDNDKALIITRNDVSGEYTSYVFTFRKGVSGVLNLTESPRTVPTTSGSGLWVEAPPPVNYTPTVEVIRKVYTLNLSTTQIIPVATGFTGLIESVWFLLPGAVPTGSPRVTFGTEVDGAALFDINPANLPNVSATVSDFRPIGKAFPSPVSLLLKVLAVGTGTIQIIISASKFSD